MFLLKEHIPLFFLSLIILTGLSAYGFFTGINSSIYMGMTMVVSMTLFLVNPVHLEMQEFNQRAEYSVKGKIQEIQKTQYYTFLLLEDVILESENEEKKLKSRVQVRSSNKQEYTPNDEIKLKVKWMETEPQMNPSDFNYETYLRAKAVGSSFKETALIDYKRKDTVSEKTFNFLEEKLSELYSAEQLPLMEALLLGKDDAIDDRTKELYNASGIGHVLCISGFHVGIMMTLFITLLSLMGISYVPRYLLAIIGVWCFAAFTGSSTSTVRAAVMVTVMLLGKCLWQEEDSLTSLSAASLLILLVHPYELFQAGFQLSFSAVSAICIITDLLEEKEKSGVQSYRKWQKRIILTLAVQAATWPVLAYHFYEVPLLIGLMNLLIVPLFTLIIIGGWLSLILYTSHLMLVPVLAKGIEGMLKLVESILSELIKWPLATWCTGKPMLWQYVLAATALLLLVFYLRGYLKSNAFWKGMLVTGFIWQSFNLSAPNNLNITLLYVGQGDSTVIETPKHQFIVIDGGNFGKGQVVENYIKYRGKRRIDAIFVSHSDADHIGGLIELIDSNMYVNQVFISKTDSSDLLNQFIQKCQQKSIAVYKLGSKESFYLDKLKINCLAPAGNTKDTDSNNNSLVCLLEYRYFKGLFTGDKGKDSDTKIYDETGNISLLKVSHHGSRTGTSRELLLKLNPMYAMMSCGRNNLYGHPHSEVLELLSECNVAYSRTDKNGAICYETDGYYIKEMRYREDD